MEGQVSWRGVERAPGRAIAFPRWAVTGLAVPRIQPQPIANRIRIRGNRVDLFPYVLGALLQIDNEHMLHIIKARLAPDDRKPPGIHHRNVAAASSVAVVSDRGHFHL